MKYIWVFFLIITLSFSAKLDNSVIDANASYYNQLLNKISENNNSDPLEKTLLLQIINFKPAPLAEQNITNAKNSKELSRLFDIFIEDIQNILKYSQRLKEREKKIETIEEEIKKLDSNSSKLITYELQDAFYHKQVIYYKNMVKNLKSQLSKTENAISGSIVLVTVKKDKILQKTDIYLKQSDTLKENITKLNIALEQAELIKDEQKVKNIGALLEKKKKELFDKNYKIFQNRFLLFVYYLKLKEQKTFAIEKELYKDAKNYNILSKDGINGFLSPFLLSLEKKYIGKIQTLTGSGKQELIEVLYQGWEFVNKPIFDINGTPISIFKMAFALIIFILGVIAGLLYKNKIKNIKTKRSAFTSSTKTLLANLGYYLIVIISFLISLNILGVKLSSLAIVAGALSVGIGFGLQNIVSNFVSGIILMFERSIKIGDYIEVGENRGYVTDIRMRSTTIKTNENIDIVIPNQQFIESNVINWTMNDKIRRFSIPFGVAYGSDADKVAKVVKEAVLESDCRSYIIDKAPRETQVIMTEMADSSVNFELLIWLAGSDLIDRPKRTKSYFLTIIYKTLYKHGIEIPFPQQDLHIRSISDEIIKNFKNLKDN